MAEADEKTETTTTTTEDGTAEEHVEIEEIESEEIKTQKHDEALSFKEQGNAEFRESRFDTAADFYLKGLNICPKSYAKTRSVLHGNRGACFVKMDMNEAAIENCTLALDLDAHYTKARLRRAQLYEKTEKLDDALKDYNEILTYDRTCKEALIAAQRLPTQINERNEKLKNEMFSKLKDLGNTCLKPFGLSTNNFQVQQDPNTGGYSVNFKK